MKYFFESLFLITLAEIIGGLIYFFVNEGIGLLIFVLSPSIAGVNWALERWLPKKGDK